MVWEEISGFGQNIYQLPKRLWNPLKVVTYQFDADFSNIKTDVRNNQIKGEFSGISYIKFNIPQLCQNFI